MNGRFSLGIQAENTREPLPFPRELILDITLLSVSPQFALLAAMLIFKDCMLGESVNVPSATESLDNAVRRAFLDRAPKLRVDQKQVSKVDDQITLIIGEFRSSAFPKQPNGKGRNVLFQFRDSTKWTGKIFSTTRVELVGNLSLFEATEGSELPLKVALGLLLLGDWKASSLVVEDANSTSIDVKRVLQSLCGSVGVSLRIVCASELEEILDYD